MNSEKEQNSVNFIGKEDVSIVVLLEKQLQDLRKLAALRYTISEIALMLDVPVEALRLRMTDRASPEYRAYAAGCLESEIPHRDRVRKEAENGEEWAIRMIEKWKTAQQADELGCHI